MQNTIPNGTLYIVSTPIGNLKDITYRAVQVLQQVDLIAAEDTRRTRTLCQEYQVRTPITSFHSYNKSARTPQFLSKLEAGESIALVTDAGTPGISDPGFHLISAAAAHGCHVVPIPGASALLAGLAASGLPTDRFVFEGFLPAKKGRKRKIAAIAEEQRTVVLFEAPHRLLKTLKELEAVLDSRQVVVGRELTKIYEEFIRGSCTEVLQHFSKTAPRGEFVLVIEGLKK
jgi:16S rRNA (cytidine1402-2'-O)-methyltransferase